MKRVKKRIFSGSVCEQLVYNIPDKGDVRTARPPRPRFRDERERAHHRAEISRRRHARLANGNWDPSWIYATLTFSIEEEVHTFEEAKQLARNYINRLKRKCPGAKIFLYMGRGKHTHRIHLHMVCWGIPEEVIAGKWGYGTVLRMEHLRRHNYYDGVDRGQDYTGLANYLWNHWTEEQVGHRWKNTTNIRKPEEETPREVRREYSEKKPPRPPKGYILVETRATRYGLLYFKYVVQPEPDSRKRKKADGAHRL